jgi:transcription antitermination factor NusG
MNATETVDKPDGVCQQAITSETVSLLGETGVVGTQRETDGVIKFTHGGVRSGAGRKPKPLAPTQISYAVDTPRWYCVRTDYGAETAVDMAIRTAGFETLYPMEWVPPVAARRTVDGRAIPARSERLEPLLPRYLLVRFDRSNPSWRFIPTMAGVERVFSTHPERPTPIPDRDIDDLQKTLAPNGVKYPDADPEPAARTKKRWVNMLEALAARSRYDFGE